MSPLVIAAVVWIALCVVGTIVFCRAAEAAEELWPDRDEDWFVPEDWRS